MAGDRSQHQPLAARQPLAVCRPFVACRLFAVCQRAARDGWLSVCVGAPAALDRRALVAHRITHEL